MKGILAVICAIGLVPALAHAEAPEKAPGQSGAAVEAAASAEASPTVGLEQVVGDQIEIDRAARASQERVNELDDESNALLVEYRRALADAESFETYSAQLELQVRSQEEEKASMLRQLAEVETTSREVGPLMEKMLSTLDQFVALDMPFLVAERRDRVERLKEMMGRADVTISEKYRRIVEAYQVEMDYGRTVEAYEANLGDGSDARTVQFLRIGRVGLLYQTLDGRETGYWDVDGRKWVVDDQYADGFKEGIAVAKKVRAPELLILPVPAPKEAQS
ncbi:MAG: DUF3450 domain-containing protein [Deltaproteobacteria bacterium]|nr:DUF3450 domain-containing protein [Deltaproteobacteria bacterium]